MTDRIKGFTVTLDHPVRVDDVEAIEMAIRMIKGVAHVEPSIDTAADHMNREVIRGEYKIKFYEFIKNL